MNNDRNKGNEHHGKYSEQSKSNGNDIFKVTGDWAAQSILLKEKYSQLTDDDLKFETGKEDELLVRVETRLNKKRGEVINILKKGQSA